MVLFKSCPRCSGDRTLEHDMYGWYILCLACGHVAYPKMESEEDHALQDELEDSGSSTSEPESSSSSKASAKKSSTSEKS